MEETKQLLSEIEASIKPKKSLSKSVLLLYALGESNTENMAKAIVAYETNPKGSQAQIEAMQAVRQMLMQSITLAASIVLTIDLELKV